MVRLLSKSWLFVLLFHLCTCLIRDLENGSDKMNEEELSDNSKELQPTEPPDHNSLALTVTVAILVDVLLILFLNVFMALKKNPTDVTVKGPCSKPIHGRLHGDKRTSDNWAIEWRHRDD